MQFLNRIILVSFSEKCMLCLICLFDKDGAEIYKQAI